MTVGTNSGSPRRPSQADWLIYALAGISAVVAVFCGAAPTGLRWWDAVLVAVLVAGAVIAAADGPSWASVALTVPAAAAAGAAGVSVWAVAGWLGLALALAATAVPDGRRLLRALAVAVAAQALLRLPAFGPFGLPSLMAGLGFVVLFAGRYSVGRRTFRRRCRMGLLIGVVIVSALTLVGGLALLSARADVERGVAAAERGLNGARSGDADTVAAELGQAAEALRAAKGRAGGVAGGLLRFVPIAAQHQRALSVVTTQGAAIASEAAAVANEADLDSIRLVAGNVDLDTIQRLAPRLGAVVATLDTGRAEIEQVRSGWLLPQVSERVDGLVVEIDQLFPTAELAAEAMSVMPGLLGGDGARSYFVILGTPAESREFGGFLGSWVLLDVERGRLSIAQSGRIRELYDTARSTSLAADLAPPWFFDMAQPVQYPQNLTSSPDFRTVADVGRSLFADAFDAPIDGFLYLDPWAVIELLRLTGPVTVPAADTELSADNAAQFFFRDQYAATRGDRNELFDGLADIGQAVLETLPDRELPGPETLSRTLGPVVRAGRLQMVTFDERENDFLEAVHLLRPFGPGDTPDFVGVVQTNGTPSKLDLYLTREVTYDVRVGADGSLAGTVRVDLRSVVPPDTPPAVVDFTLGPDQYEGINRVLLSLYTPHALAGVRLNGVADGVNATTEFGLERYLIEAPVPPTGELVSVEFDVVGSVDPSVPYEATVWHQPLVNDDAVTVRYSGPFSSFSWEAALTETTVVSAERAD